MALLQSLIPAERPSSVFRFEYGTHAKCSQAAANNAANIFAKHRLLQRNVYSVTVLDKAEEKCVHVIVYRM